MSSFTKSAHQVIDKIHLVYLGILSAAVTLAMFTIHRPPSFLVLIGGTVIVSVCLAVVFS